MTTTTDKPKATRRKATKKEGASNFMSMNDFADAVSRAAADAKPLDAGVYDGMISAVQVTVSKRSGNDMVVTTILDTADESDRRWNHYAVMVDKEGRLDLRRIQRTLRKFGADDAEFEALTSKEDLQELLVRYLLNQNVEVDLTVTDDGEHNNVRYFNPAP